MDTNLKEVLNEKTVEKVNNDKGRKLTAKQETFVVDEGEHEGVITGAFWYKTEEERDRVMLAFELEDGMIFKSSVDGEWIENYPFSKLISHANISYVQDFIGLKVVLTVRNVERDEKIFSNIKKLNLVE